MNEEHPDERDDVPDGVPPRPAGSGGPEQSPQDGEDAPPTPGDGRDSDPNGDATNETVPDGSDAAGADAGGPDADEPDADEAFGAAFDPDFDADPDAFGDLELDEHELQHIRRDLDDLADFESAFRPEGYRGVAVWCQDCSEEHFYPWDMLRENLQVLIETGETPVHEPAFAPEPERYVPWDYARGYVDALRDTGVDQRLDVDSCPRCRLTLTDDAAQANYCPRCAAPLLVPRLLAALATHGVDASRIEAILREAGLPG